MKSISFKFMFLSSQKMRIFLTYFSRINISQLTVKEIEKNSYNVWYSEFQKFKTTSTMQWNCLSIHISVSIHNRAVCNILSLQGHINSEL